MLKSFFNYILLLSTMVLISSCFSETGTESSSGKLFSGHQQTSNVFSLAPSYNSTYIAGDTINLFFTHSFDITVTGTPRVELNLDGNIVFANYVSGSNTKTIQFQYTIQAGDNDIDGVDIANTIDLNGGALEFTENETITNALTMFTVPSNVVALVDTTIPQITTLIPSTPGLFRAEQSFQIGIVFDESVVISGTPKIALNLDGNIVNLDYLTGSGSPNILFQYTVQETDQDLNGILPLSPVNLAGATIKDAAGNTADLSFATGTIPTTLVDGTRPYIKNFTAPIAKTYFFGESIQIQTQFNTPVNVTGTPRIEFTQGGTTTYLDYSSGSGSDTLVFEYSILLGDYDIDGIEITNLIDLNGGTIENAASDSAFLDFISPLTPNTFINAKTAEVTSIVAPNDQDYVDTNELFFILNFDQVITVSGTPEIQIQLATGLVNAIYQSGSSTSSLVFKYTVQNSDNDSNGIELQNSIILNTGTLVGSNTLNANLDISSAVSALTTTGITINSSNSFILSVLPPTNGTHIENQNLDFTINTSQPVNVIGTPRLILDIGGTSKFANYTSGSGTNTLTFRYTVESGLEDLDGITLTSPIDLNNGTILDLASQPLNTIFTSPDLSLVLVDSSLPIIAITTPTDLSYINSTSDSATFAITGTCNENGQTVLIEVDAAAANSPVGFVCDGTNFSGTIDTTSLSETTHTIQAKIFDVASNQGVSSINNVIKDVTTPLITGLTPPAAGTFTTSENIDFIINFSENVDVINFPRLELNIGGNTVYAEYFSGAGTMNITYRYVVLLSDSDGDGINISNTIIDLNTTGIIQDPAANDSALDFTTFNPDLTLVLVNLSPVTITSITAPIDNTYIETENIDFIVNTSELVNVVGSPVLTIDIGGTTKQASYFSGTGTTALIFRYVVEAGLEDLDGILMTPPLNLNGGTIESAGAQALDPTYTSPDLSLVLVDSIVPTVSITAPNDLSFINLASNSTTYTISGTCNENGQTVLIEVDAAAATSPVGFVCDGTNFSGTIDTSGLAEAAHTLQAKITDTSGNEGSSSIINTTKDVTAPSISSIVPPANKTWINGETLSFSLTYNENITVTGTPKITSTIGGSTYDFDYQSGSGTSTLLFSLTLTGGEEDTDGIALTSSALNLNSGLIDDVAGNNSNLNLDANILLPNLSSVLVDAIIPTVTITTAADISSANHTNYSLIGTCSEDGQTINISIGGITITTPCSSGTWSTTPTDVSSLPDNSALIITADHSDLAGNNAVQASITVNKSVATPLVEITNAVNISQANHTAYSVSGTCSENGRIVTVMIGSLAVAPNCSGGSWTTITTDVSPQPDSASFVITADHENAASVAAVQASVTVVKDTSAPTVIISSAPAITNDNKTNYMVSGTCSENGRTVDVYIDTLNFLPTCASGAWTTGFVDVSALSDDPAVPITADHDNASAVAAEQASTTVVKSTTTPTVSNLSISSTLANSAVLHWTITDPGGFTLNDHIINYRIKGTPTWLIFDDGISLNNETTVTGLVDSTTYEFRVALTYDISQTSAFTNIAEGVTLPDNPLFSGPHKAMNVGGSTDTNVVAFYDGTKVYLNGTEIAASPLDKGEVANITTVRYDVIDADGPIYTAGRLGTGAGSSGGNIVWNPTSWAGKTFNFSAIRTNPQTVWVYATEDTTVQVKNGSTLLDTLTLTAGNGGTLSWSVYGSFQMISTGTVLAYHISGTGGAGSLVDPKPLLPASLEVIGFPSNSMTLTTDVDATNYTLIHGNSTAGSGALSRADAISVTNQGGAALYAGNSLLINADKKIAGYSYADSNGSCAAPFLPSNLMRKNYIINSDADYVAFASKVAGTIAVYSPTQTIGVDTPAQTLTLTRSGTNPNAPYNARVGTTTQGYRFIATVPVAGWYQPNNSTGSAERDETILYGTDL